MGGFVAYLCGSQISTQDMLMKAAICTQYGPPEVLAIQEVPRPRPKADEVLVKIMSSAVNSGDVRVRGLAVEGLMKVIMRLVLGISKPRKPILGTVYAGTVEEVGAKAVGFNVGDRVFGMTGFGFGTHAEYVAVKANGTISPMPTNATFDEAASLVFGGQTAIYFLEKAKLAQKTNPTVLIIGATGAVGVAAEQLSQQYGANVTAVCSSAGRPLVEELGVSNIILYDQEDFTQLNDRFDLVFDAVGKTTQKQCKKLVAEGGIYKTVGGMEYASESRAQLTQLKELFEKGRLRAIIDRSFRLDAIVEAHRYVDSGRKKGSVVVRIA